MWPDIALCLWSLAPRLAPQISLAALTLGISAAHASPMHDPASNFHPVQLNRVFLRSAMASPDTTSGMASAPQTEPSHHRDRISWCRRLQQPASPWRSPSTPSRVMDSAGERSHERTCIRSRRQRPRCRHPGRSRHLRSLSATQHADNARSWLPSVSRGWLFPACQCAPVLAVVKQRALDGGCGPA
jgi:hypothetical protein